MTNPKPEWDMILSYAQKNNPTAIHQLITQQSVPPNHANGVGQSSLHVSAIWGHDACVSTLLSLGADPNLQNSIMGSTPLHSCLSFPPNDSNKPWKKKLKCVELLVEGGANVYLKDLQGNTPLDVLETLVEREKGMEPEYVTAVWNVLNAGGQESMEIHPFLEQELEGMAQETISTVSERFQAHWDGIVQREKENGNANLTTIINERDAKTLRTPLLVCIDELLTAFEEEKDSPPDLPLFWTSLIQELLSKGADPNVTAQKKLEPESYKEETHRPLTRICRALIEAPPLDQEASNKYVDCLKGVAVLLKEHKAESSKGVKDIMHEAARKGRLDVLKFYVDTLGFDPNTKGRQGFTALHFSARSGKTNIVRWLMCEYSGSIAVDRTVCDDAGKTPLDLAIANKKQDCVDLLS